VRSKKIARQSGSRCAVKKTMQRKHLQFAIALLAAAAAASAQTATPHIYRSGDEWVMETQGSLPAAKKILIKTSAGFIHIQGAAQSNISYVARKHVRAVSEEAARREFTRLHVTSSNSVEQSAIHGDSDNLSRGGIDFEVRVPARTLLVRLETKGGAVAASHIDGRVSAATGGGAIHLDEISEDASASSGGGDIEVGTIGGNVKVETGGGDIHIGSAGGQVVAMSGGGALVIGAARTMVLETGGGSIRVSKCGGTLKASSGGGTIQLNEVSGHAVVKNGGGSIHLGPVSGGVRAETGSGPIIVDLAATKGNFTDSQVETSAGDIIVYVPDDLGVNIRAAIEAANGLGIRSDFPALKITGADRQWGPHEAFAEGSLNGGGPLLHVHTATGNIEIKRKTK
jgi:DUF4097 and DUF4098 domain-containing protein YvlB